MYRLKHLPTGLYFQPHKHRGSHLSKKGKVYQTKTNGLSTSLKYAERFNDLDTRTFGVYCQKDSLIHKQTKDILNWEQCKRSHNQLIAKTKLKDWVQEKIN